MEFGELAHAVKRYRALILGLVIAAMAVAAISHIGDTKTYTASARLVLDTPDPESRAESAAIADTAKALATSPTQVRDALRKAHVTDRDATTLAGEDVSVRALGSSAVIQLSVTDRNRRAAMLIANALAAEVIAARLDVTSGAAQQVLGTLDRRLGKLNTRISRLDANIAALTVAAADATSSVPRTQLNEAERSRDLLAQQRSVVEGQRIALLANEAARPKPAIVSEATQPETANSSRLLPDMLLAGIAALIVAVGTAGIVETTRRRVIGGAALARAFDTPLLGTIRSRLGDESTFDSDPGIAIRVVLAAEAARVTDVALFPVGRPIDTAALAERLQRATADIGGGRGGSLEPNSGLPRMTSSAGLGAGAARSSKASENGAGLSVRPFGAGSPNGESRTGLVVVSPAALTKEELDQAAQLVHRTSVPLLGLVAVTTVPAPPSRLDESESVRERLERVRSSA
jgi:capsular polysaccharide biosynthesis protein